MPLLNQILGIPTAFAQVSSNAVSNAAQDNTDQLSKLVAGFLAGIPLWIAAIVIAILSYALATMVRRSIENKLTKEGVTEEHREVQIVASRSAFFVVLIIGITTALSIVGIDLKPIVAAGAFGLGFALQDIIMNLISGMMILAAHHYTIGDIISVNGVSGRIEEIQTRATIIKAFDGTKVIVPNADLFSNVVISKTSNPFRKLSFIQGVGYNADLKQVMDLTLAVVKNIPGVLAKPKPTVIFTDWDDTYVLFKINVWIESKGGKMVKVKNRVIMDIYNAYNEAGIDVPYPIQTIHMDKGEADLTPQDQIDQKVSEIKKRIKDRQAAANKPMGVAVLATPTMTVPVESTAPVTPVAPALPTAIETTPNNAGQAWLQQALVQQQTQVVTPTAPVETAPSVVATPTPSSVITPPAPAVTEQQPNV